MSILAIVLFSQANSAKAILDRYAAYRKAHPAISADWSLGAGNHVIAHGTILLDGTKRLLFKSTSGPETYSLSETEKGVMEIAPNQETYDEWPAQSAIAIPPSRLTPTGALFVPQPLLYPSLYAKQLKYTVEPPVTINGDKADVVSWEVVIAMVPTRFTLAIDSEGRLLQFSRSASSGGSPSGDGMAKIPLGGQEKRPALIWTIRNYRSVPHTSLLAFFTPLPRGFTPYSMPPTTGILIGVDQPFPVVPWRSGAGDLNLKTLAGGKPEMILITAPDCVPSQKALADLDKLKSMTPGVGFVAVSLARTATEARGLPFDLSGKASAAIGETSTPLFVLVDGSGKIKNLWAGFDPQGEAAFAKQIGDALKILASGQS